MSGDPSVPPLLEDLIEEWHPSIKKQAQALEPICRVEPCTQEIIDATQISSDASDKNHIQTNTLQNEPLDADADLPYSRNYSHTLSYSQEGCFKEGLAMMPDYGDGEGTSHSPSYSPSPSLSPSFPERASPSSPLLESSLEEDLILRPDDNEEENSEESCSMLLPPHEIAESQRVAYSAGEVLHIRTGFAFAYEEYSNY